jgi:hypothetical protein
VRILGSGFVVLALAYLAAGCGTSHYTVRRNAVNNYFVQVDRAEAPLVRKTNQIDRTFGKFKIAGNSPAEVRKLELARKQIAVTLRKVRALEPPPAARKIHNQIVRLLEQQDSVASDLVLTTSYVPRLAAILVPLERADTRLTSDLNQLDRSGAKQGKSAAPVTLGEALAGFADAFSRYGASLQPVGKELDALRPPLELRNELLVQRSAVHRSIALSAAIVAALGKKDVKTANADIHTLFTLASQTSVIGTPQAEAKAIRAYDARIAAIVKQEQAISRERTRLVRDVG